MRIGITENSCNMHIVINSVFVGFGFYSLVAIFNLSTKFISEFDKELFDKISCQIFSIVGLLFVSNFIFNIYLAQTTDYKTGYNEFDMALGPNWIIYLSKPFVILVTSQLMWFRKLRMNRIIRFIIGLVLVLPIEIMLIELKNINTEFPPSSWSLSTPIDTAVFNWIVNMSVYLSLAFGVYFIQKRLKNKSI